MTFRSSYQRLFSAAAALLLTGSLAAFAAINPTQITLLSRPSGTTPGVESNGRSFGPVSLSANGRLVAFSTFARNFYAPDSNTFSDIYVRDQANNFTSIVSLGNPAGGSSSTINNRVVANGSSSHPSISPNDGRFVAFQSDATNLDPALADTNTAPDVYVRDRFGDVIRASVSSFGAQGPANAGSFNPSISDPQFDQVTGDTRVWVAYHSDANNLDGLENPDNTSSDVFVTEIGPGFFFGSLLVNDTRRVSVGTDGSPANGASRNASLSANGRFVVFESTADNLVEDDGNSFSDIFLVDLVSDTVEIISAERDDQGNVTTDSDGDSYLPSISADGRYIVYLSDSTIHDFDDSGSFTDVFLYDRLFRTTERVSFDSFGDEAEGDSILLDINGDPDPASRPSVSADGRFVVFFSDADTLDENDGNGFFDVFIHDREDGETRRLSAAGTFQGDGDSRAGAISANGNMVAFESEASSMIPDDGNFVSDIFAIGTGVGGPGGGGEEPIADAGTDLLAFEQDVVFLDGTLSEDSEGGSNLTFQWTQIDNGAPAVELDDPTSPTPSFIAPLVSEATEFEFELIVFENGTPSEPDDLFVLVDIAPPATISGTVVDFNGNPIVGAEVTVVREDGEEADSVLTDGAGNYEVQGVRVGPNVITVSAPDFEPEQRELDVFPGDVLDEDFELIVTTGSIVGNVRRFDGSPVVDALVTLYDSSGEIIAEDLTDDAGEYFLADLDRFELAAGAILEVVSDDLPTWTTGVFPKEESDINVRDFQFGRLQVTVDAAKSKQRKQLKGTTVLVTQGGEELAEGFIKNANKRKLTFDNVPGGSVKVQANSPALGSISTNVNVIEGGTQKVTLKYGVSNPF